MGREKIDLIKKFTHMGFDLLLSDVDTVWLRDPVPYIIKYPDADVLTSSDHLADTTQDGGLEDSRAAGSAANIGIMFFRSSTKTLAYEWVDRLQKDDKLWDQNAFNDLMRAGSYNKQPLQSRVFYGWNGAVRFGILPVHLFCSGHTFFVQRMPARFNTQPYVVHATFQYAGTEVLARAPEAPPRPPFSSRCFFCRPWLVVVRMGGGCGDRDANRLALVAARSHSCSALSHLPPPSPAPQGKRHRFREAKIFFDPPEYYDPPNGLLWCARGATPIFLSCRTPPASPDPPFSAALSLLSPAPPPPSIRATNRPIFSRVLAGTTPSYQRSWWRAACRWRGISRPRRASGPARRRGRPASGLASRSSSPCPS